MHVRPALSNLGRITNGQRRCPMSVGRRDLVRLSALAVSALALPALADTRPLEPMRLLILGGTTIFMMRRRRARLG